MKYRLATCWFQILPFKYKNSTRSHLMFFFRPSRSNIDRCLSMSIFPGISVSWNIEVTLRYHHVVFGWVYSSSKFINHTDECSIFSSHTDGVMLQQNQHEQVDMRVSRFPCSKAARLIFYPLKFIGKPIFMRLL